MGGVRPKQEVTMELIDILHEHYCTVCDAMPECEEVTPEYTAWVGAMLVATHYLNEIGDTHG